MLGSTRSRNAPFGGFDKAKLALFILLTKNELAPAETKRIKSVVIEFHATLQTELARIHGWQKKEENRDRVKQMILDFLDSDETRLPYPYLEAEISINSEKVFGNFFNG